MGRQINLGNPPIAVDLRRSARARRLSLRVSRLDGKVGLTLPHRATEAEAMAFLRDRELWLRKHLAEVSPTQTIADGTVLPFRGDHLTLRHADVPRTALDDGELLLPLKRPLPAQTLAFLKTQARDILATRSDHYAALVDRTYTRISLRDTRSRWGSCSSKGTLMYSWRLIMAPPQVLDYVAAHEVAHLVEMNHSRAFWQVVADLMPDFDRHRRWLRQDGSSLHRYVFD